VKTQQPTRGDPQEEPDTERLGRNVTDLLNELRVAGTGIQVMFAFLLVVPFNAGWKKCVRVRSVGLLRHAVVHRDRGGAADRAVGSPSAAVPPA